MRVAWLRAGLCGLAAVGLLGGCGLLRRPACSQEKPLTAVELLSGRQDFEGCVFESLSVDGGDFRGFNLQSIQISGSILTNSNFAKAKLARAKISNSVLNGSSFADADLRGASFTFSSFIGADFSRADLRGANLSQTNFKNAITTDVLTDETTICPSGHNGPCQFH